MALRSGNVWTGRSSAAVAAAVVLASVAPVRAAVTIDGTRDAAYGTALTVQAAPTGFGDNNDASGSTANGSELDAAYAVIEGGNLKLFLAGNLETNFNKLEIFFDSVAGAGQNRLLGNNADVDFNGLNRLGDAGTGNGLTFDSGFAPDFWVSLTGGGTPTGIFANYATLPTGGAGTGGYLGQTTPKSDGTLTGGGAGTTLPAIQLTFDNSNIAGVTGATGTGGELVATGIELSIPLSALGNPTGPFAISALVNGGGHDFLSNQVLGPLASTQGNLGDPRNVDLNQFAGNQFFVVPAVPEPTALAVLALGGGLSVLRRRRNG
jgi:hypothetical protein